MKINTIEELRQKNRDRVIRHIGQVVYQRVPNPDEVYKINLMIDIGKKIPEILASLRLASEISNNSECVIKVTSPTNDSSVLFSNKVGFYFLASPLEKYFHKYVTP